MSNDLKAKVWRAALSQFKKELKVTQKGVLKIMGSGSEQTIAKYLNLIKAELSNQEIAVFSPELPPELIPVLENIYHTSMEYAVASLNQERDLMNEEAQKAINISEKLKSQLEIQAQAAHEKDIELINAANKTELLRARVCELESIIKTKEEEVINISNDRDRVVERGVLARANMKAECMEDIASLKSNFTDRIGSLNTQLATLSNEKKEAVKQIDFERSRSEEETARLYREIDSIKMQCKEEKESLVGMAKRIESELDISHAREDRERSKVGSLNAKIERLEADKKNLEERLVEITIESKSKT